LCGSYAFACEFDRWLPSSGRLDWADGTFTGAALSLSLVGISISVVLEKVYKNGIVTWHFVGLCSGYAGSFVALWIRQQL